MYPFIYLDLYVLILCTDSARSLRGVNVTSIMIIKKKTLLIY